MSASRLTTMGMGALGTGDDFSGDQSQVAGYHGSIHITANLLSIGIRAALQFKLTDVVSWTVCSQNDAPPDWTPSTEKKQTGVWVKYPSLNVIV